MKHFESYSLSLKIVFEHRHGCPALEQTTHLHQDTAVTIDLKGSMRLHKFSHAHFLGAIRNKLSDQSPDQSQRSSLIDRLQDMLLRLDYYDMTSQTLLNQQQNLLNLVSQPSITSRDCGINGRLLRRLTWKLPPKHRLSTKSPSLDLSSCHSPL